LKYVKYFGEDGIALRQTFNFPVIGEVPLYPYPHPEQVTIPKYIKCRRVTNKGSVLPNEYYDLTREIFRLGLGGKEPLAVKGKKVIPYDFAIAYIIRERERILKEKKFGPQRGCVTVVVKGKKNGQSHEFRASMASQSQALGEGTGIPAAMGAILMGMGKIKGKGVLPPEACVNPGDFLALLPKVMKLDSKKEGGKAFGGIIAEHVDGTGKVSKLNF
jgi:saccharopine dehydrogenase (NAD+, L-lysine-forming)